MHRVTRLPKQKLIGVLMTACLTSLFAMNAYSVDLEVCAMMPDDFMREKLGCPKDIVYSRELLCKAELTSDERQALAEATFPEGYTMARPWEFQEGSAHNHDGVVHYIWLELTSPDEENNFRKSVVKREWAEPTTEFITDHRSFYYWDNGMPLSESEFTETIGNSMYLLGTEWSADIATSLDTYTVNLQPNCPFAGCENILIISREDLQATTKTVGVEKRYDCQLTESSYEETMDEVLANIKSKIKESLAKNPIGKKKTNKI